MKTANKVPSEVWIIVHDYQLSEGSAVEHLGSGYFFLSEGDAITYINKRGSWIGAPSRSRMRAVALVRNE